jgi:hypothetical protein
MKCAGISRFALAVLLGFVVRPAAAALSAQAGADRSAPVPVVVFECPAACRWLTGASIAHVPISASELERATLPADGVLVVPLDQVRTEACAGRIAEFAARGGRLLAVYWGPLVRPEAQGGHPVYTLGPVVGIRPLGWRGADPIRVRPGDRAGATEEIGDLRLARGPLIRLDPLPGATIVARWTPAGRRNNPAVEGAVSPAAAGPEGTLAVGLGNHLYLAVDLFAPQNDTAEGRQFFLWALNQLVPGLVFNQARERAGAAMAAVIRAETELGLAEKARPEGDYAAAREKLKEARECAVRAKQAAATDRFFEATANSVRAIALSEEAVKLLAPPLPAAAESSPPPIPPGDAP